ncbi:MAG: hypothetical protein EP330_03630 [Deltaproteobacteria bacterium]|nr:MAG: hypothetical protein EP330_03630 [Deltaproteobacteria bacterium]
MTPLILVLLACGQPEPEPVDPLRKVLVVGWDGVRADAIDAVDTPNLDRLHVDTAASTQLTGPTKSAPGWMSVLTGVEPEKHGVVANGEYDGRDASWTTLATRANEAGAGPVVAAVHWPEVLASILEPESTADATLGTDEEVASWMAAAIDTDDGRVGITHFDDPDHAGHAGHASGYSVDNPEYTQAIAGDDAFLGEMLDAIEASVEARDESWLVLVTTDHGGEGTDHGPQEPVYQEIFLAAGVFGEAVDFDFAGTSHLDVTPTALTWLGVAHEGLDGNVLIP